MTPVKKVGLVSLLVLFATWLYTTNCFGQSHSLDPEKWATEINREGKRGNDSLQNLIAIITKNDSASAFKFLDQLQQEGKNKGDYFKIRFNYLNACVLYLKLVATPFYQHDKSKNAERIKDEIKRLYSNAIDLAYRLEDDVLIAYVSYGYGSLINQFGEKGLSVMYTKNGVDLYEKIGEPVFPEVYQFLSELFYQVREYEECIKYGKKAMAAWQNSKAKHYRYMVSGINTVALGYHRQKIFDSAFLYYNRAIALAHQTNDTLWVGIISGNLGQIFYAQAKYDTAYSLLKFDYLTSNQRGYYDNAGNSLQWAARTNLARGNKEAALAEIREAFQILKLWPDANYSRNAFYTATQVFRALGIYDSAFYYNNLYAILNDSLEKVVATSSLAISQSKLNDEISRYTMQTLNNEKRSQLMLRNIIIGSIILLSFVVLLIVNRQRLKEKMKTEKAEQEKARMEQEVASAREQLDMFTQNIVEKAYLIEQLELQVKGKQVTEEQQAIMSELSRQTILTEEDWIKFKALFETIHQGFFIKLKDKFPDITIAEQRMAALTRLRLTTKQIASMLGISVDSVHKSRQRLRQRFHIGSEASLDEMVTQL